MDARRGHPHCAALPRAGRAVAHDRRDVGRPIGNRRPQPLDDARAGGASRGAVSCARALDARRGLSPVAALPRVGRRGSDHLADDRRHVGRPVGKRSPRPLDDPRGGGWVCGGAGAGGARASGPSRCARAMDARRGLSTLQRFREVGNQWNTIAETLKADRQSTSATAGRCFRRGQASGAARRAAGHVSAGAARGRPPVLARPHRTRERCPSGGGRRASTCAREHHVCALEGE